MNHLPPNTQQQIGWQYPQPMQGNNTAFNAATLDKIIRNQYVDFASLIRNDANDSLIITQFDGDGSDQTQLLVMANQRAKSELTYTQWQKAFYIFATVYCKAHPQQFANLLKYADNIREMFVTRAIWRHYDEHCRRTRESYGWPWDVLQMELWGKAMAIFRDCEEPDTPSSSGSNRRHPPPPPHKKNGAFPRQERPGSSRPETHSTRGEETPQQIHPSAIAMHFTEESVGLEIVDMNINATSAMGVTGPCIVLEDHFLVNGFIVGFNVPFKGTVAVTEVRNLVSAHQYLSIVT